MFTTISFISKSLSKSFYLNFFKKRFFSKLYFYTKIQFIFFFFLIQFIFSASLQLVDEKNKGISELEVFFEESAEISTTDNEGKIKFSKKIIGNQKEGKVQIISEDYQETKFQISFEEDVVLTLKKKKKDLKQLTSVKVGRKGYKRTDQKISKKQLTQQVQYNLGDVVKTLQTRPGVSSSGSQFTSDMYIQGGSGEEWVGILDHIWVLQPRRWNGRISMFNPLLVQSIDFYTAGYPSSVGQGLSGILWVNSLEPSREKWNFYFGFDAGFEGMAHGYLTKDIALVLNIRRLWLDLVIDLAQSGDKDEKFKNPYLFDGMAKVIWEINKFNHLQFLFYFSNEGLDNISEFQGSTPSATPGPNSQGQSVDESDKTLSSKLTFYDNYLIFALKHTLRFSTKNYLVFNAAILPQFGNVKQLDNTDFTVTNNNSSLPWQLTADYAFNEIENHELRAGLFYYHYNNSEDGTITYNYFTRNRTTGAYIRTNESREIKTENEGNDVYSAYVSDNWTINDFFTLRFGTRINFYQIGKTEETTGELNDNFLSFIVGDDFKNELTIEPRAEVVFNLTKNLNFFTKGGYYTSSNPRDANYYGRPQTTSEKSAHSVTGVNFRNFYFEVLAEGFYKNYWQTRQIDGNLKFNNYGERISYGGDIYFSLNENPSSIFYGYLSYTYIHAKEKVTKRDNEDAINTLVDPYLPTVGEEFDPSFLRNHTFNIFLKVYPLRPLKLHETLNNTYMTFTFSALSGKPYTRAIDVEKNNSNLRIIYGDYNVDRLDPIYNLTFQIGQRVNKNFEWFVSLINVLSTENILEYSYNVKQSYKDRIAEFKEGERLGADAIQRNKILDAAKNIQVRGSMKFYF